MIVGTGRCRVTVAEARWPDTDEEVWKSFMDICALSVGGVQEET